ncbi:peptidoglycan DD-metalloendopeptidase family protein [Maribacter sp. 2304DJ31-5]|uniref:peptidoglycan DD-metalloendopeptidase family protein n=1 Tax=Maribacter sp. 2304DJ31-5 TaxID=3386273 RepID=UPI0039BC4731
MSEYPVPILDNAIPINAYVPIDLSVSNPEIKERNIADPADCQAYIDTVLMAEKGRVAYGGYLEKRNLYVNKHNFSDKTSPRNIHLGMDFWCEAGTKVITPMDGVVHSYKNNTTLGDYGPTIVLEHRLESYTFHTLYGHLSVESLDELYIGKKFKAGSTLARLGAPSINVNYASHLHFQIIRDMESNFGDYPGVCSNETFDFYLKNCPDPDILLKIPG